MVLYLCILVLMLFAMKALGPKIWSYITVLPLSENTMHLSFQGKKTLIFFGNFKSKVLMVKEIRHIYIIIKN